MKLSIFGPRGCGKTTYLTCLYGQGGKVGSFAISARDEATRNYLAERWQQLFTGTEIAPTALGIVPLRLVFSANHQAYDIELQDFAGALVRHEKNQDEVKKKLKEALFKSFQESSGIMFFLEAGEVDFQSQFERRLELDALLEVLHAQEKRELITRPIAIVITKWDKVVSGVVQSDQGKEVEAFLRKNYENLYALVQECSQNVKIFASSAFGFQTSAPDGRMDFKKIHPFNLEKPFAWIGQTIDELNYRRCELFEKENPKNLKGALQEYEQFRHRVNAGPYFEKSSERVRQLKTALWLKRSRKWSLIAGTAVVLFLVGLFGYEYNEQSALLLALDPQNSKSDPAFVIQDADRYSTRPHFFANFFGWKEKIQKNRLAFQQQTEKRNFEELEELFKKRETARDLESVRNRIARYDQFRESYPSSHRKSLVNEWIQREREHLRRLEADREAEGLKMAASSLRAEELEEKIKQAQSFVYRYPESERVGEVQKWLQEWLKKQAEATANERYRQFLLGLIKIKAPRDYLAYCREYLEQNPDVSFRDKIKKKIEDKEDDLCEEAKQKALNGSTLKSKTEGYRACEEAGISREKMERIKKRWNELERDCFETLRAYADNQTIDEQHAAQAAEYARQYLEEGRFKTMAREVKQWLDWYQGISKGKLFNGIIKSAKLKKDCSLFAYVTSPDTYVVLQHGNLQVRTDEIPDNWSPAYDKSFQLTWAPGDGKKLEMRLWCTDYSNDSRTWISPDTFLPRHLNGTILIEGNEIHLMCQEAMTPDLPAYREY